MYKPYLDTITKISQAVMMGQKIYIFKSPQNVLFAVYDAEAWIKYFHNDKIAFIIKPKKK